ncbi:hypothetical protein C3L33_17426, partial [Rhododendron williamsianum]
MGLTPKPTTPAGKWLGFVTAVWMQSISGFIYGFSTYSDALKALMNLTQLQLNNLSVAKDVGVAFGLLPGLASDRIPSPLLLLIGALEALIGYGVLWLVTAKIINPLPYWLDSRNTKASLDCSFSNCHGRWLRYHGHGFAGFSVRRLNTCRHMLWDRYAIMIPTASELFGLKYYGLIYNILILNLPLGSFLFSGLLAGYLYDAQATSTAGGGNSCTGAHCYRLVFVIMSIACIIGFSLDVLLVIRTKNVYAKIYASMA